MLRRVLLGLGVAGLLVGLALLVAGAAALALRLLIGCGVLTAAVALERWRYVRRVDRTSGAWQPTGERFIDPSTGQLTEVYYDPDEGERDYRPVDASPDDPPR